MVAQMKAAPAGNRSLTATTVKGVMMAVSKRTRFEVLRRDNHTCRYCHATDAPLTVDHVIPVALGGSDDPSNLVAACRDCNSGKSSSAPEASMVADVRESALHHAEMIRQAYAVMVNHLEDKESYQDEFIDAWPWDRIIPTWRGSIAAFWRMGVPIQLIRDALETTESRTSITTADARFRYMCGIIWNHIGLVVEAVSSREALAGAWRTESDLDDLRYTAFMDGRDSLRREGDQYLKMLRYVCDGLLPRSPELVSHCFNRPQAA